MTKPSRSLKIAVLPLALLIGWISLAPLLAKNLIVEKPLSRADAILVLAGSATYRERTRKAAELYSNGIAPRVLLTDDGELAGWSQAEQRNTPFVELARRSLVERGVAAENIEILPSPPVAGTIDEARVLREKIAAEVKLKSIVLVTSAYHSRRTLRTFEKVLSDETDRLEIGIQYAPPGEQTPLPSVWWLSPFGWNMVAGEYLKSIYYWAHY